MVGCKNMGLTLLKAILITMQKKDQLLHFCCLWLKVILKRQCLKLLQLLNIYD